MKTYITGLSGTGKTTIAKELENRGYKVISIDETPGLCFWINKETKEKVNYEIELNLDFVEKHDWICDVNLLKELLDKHKEENNIFVAGISANQNEFLNLFDKIVYLKCVPEVLVNRLNNRTDNDFGKDKEVQNFILSTHSRLENNLMKFGAKVVNVDNDLDYIIESIL